MPEDFPALLGPERYALWTDFCGMLEAWAETESQWNSGGMRWKYECQYRLDGKRLCALYARKGCAALRIVFSKEEQARFQAERASYHAWIQRAFDVAEAYPDGRRFLFGLEEASLFPEFLRLLDLKRTAARE